MQRSSSDCRAIEGTYQRACGSLQTQMNRLIGISSTFNTYIQDLLDVTKRGDKLTEKEHFQIISELIENLRPCAQFRQDYFDKCVSTGESHKMTKSDISHEHARMELKKVHILFKKTIKDYKNKVSLEKGVVSRELLLKESETPIVNMFEALGIDDDEEPGPLDSNVNSTIEERVRKSRSAKGSKGKKKKGKKGKSNNKTKKELTIIQDNLDVLDEFLHSDVEKRQANIIFDIESIDPYFSGNVRITRNGFYIEPFKGSYFQLDEIENAVYHSQMITEIFVGFIQSASFFSKNKAYNISVEGMLKTLELITKNNPLLTFLRTPSLENVIYVLFAMSPTDAQMNNINYIVSIDAFFVYSSVIVQEPFKAGDVDIMIPWIFKYALEKDIDEFRINITNMVERFRVVTGLQQTLEEESPGEYVDLSYNALSQESAKIIIEDALDEDASDLSLVELEQFHGCVQCSETPESEKYIFSSYLVQNEEIIDGKKVESYSIRTHPDYSKTWEKCRYVHLPEFSAVRIKTGSMMVTLGSSILNGQPVVVTAKLFSDGSTNYKNDNDVLDF